GVPAALLSTTIKAVTLVATKHAATTGALPAAIVTLSEGVLKGMFLKRIKTAALALLIALVLGAAATAGLLALTQPPPDGARDAKKVMDSLQGAWRLTRFDVDHGEFKEQFEAFGKLVIKGNKATLLFDFAGKVADKEAITMAEFTILKVDPAQ